MELNKNNTLRKKERTMKVIEELKKKEEFFEELTREIHNNFTQEDIDFFFTLESPLNTPQSHLLKEPALTQTTNVPHCASSTPSEDNFDIMMRIPIEQELPESLNLNLYHNLVKNKMAGQQTSKIRGLCRKGSIKSRDSLKGGSITPNEASALKQPMQKNLFQIDRKMRKNYERIKQRVTFNSPDQGFKGTNAVRDVNPFYRIKTQRNNRYKTECQDQNQTEGNAIPRMFLGELNQRRSCQGEERGVGVSGVSGVSGVYADRSSLVEERRWQCFERESGGRGWRGRYKCRR